MPQLHHYTMQDLALLLAEVSNLNERRLAQQTTLQEVLACAYFMEVGVSGQRCFERHADGVDFWLEPLPPNAPPTELGTIQALMQEYGSFAERMQLEYRKLTDLPPQAVKLIERETRTPTSLNVTWAFIPKK